MARTAIVTLIVLAALAAVGLPATATTPTQNGLIVYAGYDSHGRRQLFTISPSGTGARQLTASAGENFFPAWSSDGRRIAFTSTRAGTPELWVMDAAVNRQLNSEGEAGQAAEHDAAVPLRRVGCEVELWEATNERAQRDLAFEPGEVRAETRMEAAAERHVLIRRGAAQVETPRVVAELSGIAVRGAERGHQERSGFDLLAIDQPGSEKLQCLMKVIDRTSFIPNSLK